MSNLVAFLPVYSSFRALRTPTKEDDTQWLVYWTLLGCFNVAETLYDAAVPVSEDASAWTLMSIAYMVSKSLFFRWSQEGRGATLVLTKVVVPVADVLERAVDRPENGGGDKRA